MGSKKKKKEPEKVIEVKNKEPVIEVVEIVKKKSEPYFGKREEDAVCRYLISINDSEKNRIFNEWLKAPFDKMIESIIRKYKLYRKTETFEDLHTDTLSFLMTKIHKFDPKKGTKAYSYCGTICKHYILGLLMKDEKYLKQTYSYEDVAQSIEEREDLTYTIDQDEPPSIELFIKKISISVKKELDSASNVSKKKLNENERKVGEALIEILDNWEGTLKAMDGGPKFNKAAVLETMRNFTNLSTKDIRLAMKRFKEIYEIMKEANIDNDND